MGQDADLLPLIAPFDRAYIAVMDAGFKSHFFGYLKNLFQRFSDRLSNWICFVSFLV